MLRAVPWVPMTTVLSRSAVRMSVRAAIFRSCTERRLSPPGSCPHFTVVLSDVDENLYKRLGMHVSYEAKYERQRLYYK